MNSGADDREARGGAIGHLGRSRDVVWRASQRWPRRPQAAGIIIRTKRIVCSVMAWRYRKPCAAATGGGHGQRHNQV